MRAQAGNSSTLGRSPLMSNAVLLPVRNSLEEWKCQQTQTQAELQDSLAALDAMQRQLEAWQSRLSQERDQLAAERADLDRERAQDRLPLEGVADQAAEELDESRRRVQELEAQLEQKDRELRDQYEHWNQKFTKVLAQVERGASAPPPATAPATCDPVLGSVVAQFDKIRRQRAQRDG